MSMPDLNRPAAATGDARANRTRPVEASPVHERRETKPSAKTTELWLTIVGTSALAVTYNASSDASLNLFRACLLGTIMAAAYVVSRGFAKAGSHDDYPRDHCRDAEYRGA